MLYLKYGMYKFYPFLGMVHWGRCYFGSGATTLVLLLSSCGTAAIDEQTPRSNSEMTSSVVSRASTGQAYVSASQTTSSGERIYSGYGVVDFSSNSSQFTTESLLMTLPSPDGSPANTLSSIRRDGRVVVKSDLAGLPCRGLWREWGQAPNEYVGSIDGISPGLWNDPIAALEAFEALGGKRSGSVIADNGTVAKVSEMRATLETLVLSHGPTELNVWDSGGNPTSIDLRGSDGWRADMDLTPSPRASVDTLPNNVLAHEECETTAAMVDESPPTQESR